jgi:hypothetical protein
MIQHEKTMESLICPACHSDEGLRRTQRKNKAEGLLKFIGIKTYRCSACYWRGYIRQKRDGAYSYMGFSERTVELVWKCFITMIAAFIGLVVIPNLM